MTALFPRLLPDELLYSAVARFRDHLRYPDEKAVLDACFGRRTGIAVVELPGRLDAFVERLPPGHGYTVQGLVDGHTTLPYYQRFLSPGIASNAAFRLRTAGGAGLPELVGIRASTVPSPTQLRFCPRCAEEDRARHGEAYWHRVHQMPGVFVCRWHESVLSVSGVRRSNGEGRHIFQSLEGAVPDAAAPLTLPQGAGVDLLTRLARDTLWLLGAPAPPIGLVALQAKYHLALAEAGFMRSRQRIRMGELVETFAARYGPRLLADLGCWLRNEPGRDDWLSRLLRKPRVAQHPLHHLLVVHFLGKTLQEFFEGAPARASAPVSPTVAPLACPNPVCGSGASVSVLAAGALRCSACGYTYRPAKAPVGRVVLAFGPGWGAKLRELAADRRVSLRAVAKCLGVTTKTVQRHAVELGCARAGWELPARSPSRRRERSAATLRRHRTTWEQLRAEYPDDGVQALVERGARAAYSYLSRFDREWFEKHRPPPARRCPRAPRVDWAARDAEVLAAVRAAVEEIIASPAKPVQVTKSQVAARTGHGAWIVQHLARLPHTAAFLEEVCETRLAFARRRVAWAAREFILGGNPVPAPWELARKAGLRPDLASVLSSEVLTAPSIALRT